MQITVELQELFSYFPIIVVGLSAIFLGLLIIFWPKKKKLKRKNQAPQITDVPTDKLETIKEKYDRLLREIEEARQEGRISDRQAYQELSGVVRDFVFAKTRIRVQNYTLEEIKDASMPQLYDLIAECYVPEFAPKNEGNIYDSIKKARKVIGEWN